MYSKGVHGGWDNSVSLAYVIILCIQGKQRHTLHNQKIMDNEPRQTADMLLYILITNSDALIIIYS